jgi:hypothetical protein
MAGPATNLLSTRAAARVQEAKRKSTVNTPTAKSPLRPLNKFGTTAVLSHFEPVGSLSFFYLMIPLFVAAKVTKKQKFVLEVPAS